MLKQKKKTQQWQTMNPILLNFRNWEVDSWNNITRAKQYSVRLFKNSWPVSPPQWHHHLSPPAMCINRSFTSQLLIFEERSFTEQQQMTPSASPVIKTINTNKRPKYLLNWFSIPFPRCHPPITGLLTVRASLTAFCLLPLSTPQHNGFSKM